MIFVIDSNDRTRIDEARQELHRIILDREMKEALLLVFANKQDITGGEKLLSILRESLDLLTMSSNEPARGPGKAEAQPAKGQDLVRRAKLRDDRRGHLRGFSKATFLLQESIRI